uniref:7TM GPCR serpentine receptor class x (Srx) domain-containing protein n=1 Tax=Strongyloides venezuelensis TaxID=75913 RepID=A0A0K0ETX5_STRVS
MYLRVLICTFGNIFQIILNFIVFNSVFFDKSFIYLFFTFIRNDKVIK